MRVTKESLRVGLVTKAFDKGGLESIVFEIYKFLKRQGYQVTIFVEKEELGFFSSLVMPNDLVVFRDSPEQFFAEIAFRRINVLHYHYCNFLLPEMASLGINIIYTLHNVYTWLDDESFRTHANAIFFSNTIVAVSSYAKNYFLKRSGAKFTDVLVIPNGVDVKSLRSSVPVPRTHFGFSDDEFIFAQFSSFHRVKNHILLIRAAEKIIRLKIPFRIVFFGNVGDKTYYNEIRSAVERSVARDYISIHGYIDYKQVGGVLRGVVDCALMVTLQEGCGNAALEAAALGIPVIMTDTGIARDLENMGVDIDVVPESYDVTKLNFDVIDRLSRTGDTDNLSLIVSAMKRRIYSKSSNDTSISDFPFEQEIMLNNYLELYKNKLKIQ